MNMATLKRSPQRVNQGFARAWSPNGRYILLGTYLVGPVTLKDVTRTPMKPVGELDESDTVLTNDALYFYWRFGNDQITAKHAWVRCDLHDLTKCARGRIH